ncbi:hypothetical protein GCM10009665_19990 [Kitasatospora nipponensis]|uniref:Uncharacterized protein n=1 Tax=Kitasatospora nipponensis TaxID=258049 RepID=A0ABP4GR31_9ACTN
MATAAVGYASLQGLGSREGCLEALRAMAEVLARVDRDAGGRAANFASMVFGSAETVEDEGIDPEVMHAVTGGTYPVAYLTVSYDPDRLPAVELEALEREFDLRVLGRTSSRALNLLGFEPRPRSRS